MYTVVCAAGRGGGNFFLLTDGRAGERDFSAFRLANPPSCFFENSLKSEFTSGERTRKHSSFPIWKLVVRLYFYTSAGCCCTEYSRLRWKETASLLLTFLAVYFFSRMVPSNKKVSTRAALTHLNNFVSKNAPNASQIGPVFLTKWFTNAVRKDSHRGVAQIGFLPLPSSPCDVSSPYSSSSFP